MDNQSKIAVCSRSFSRHPLLRQLLQEEYSNIKFNDEGLSLKGEGLVHFLKDCNKAIIALENLDSDILGQLPSLSVVAKYGVGLDSLDFRALEKRGIRLGWTPGVNALAVAELTLALALSIVRGINSSVNLTRDGQWQQVVGRELSSLTYGILGCGHVGKKLVQLLRGFGCRVISHDKDPDLKFFKENKVEAVSYSELIHQSDVLSIHVPKNKTTLNIISKTQINKMKKGAFLINTARGGLIDEKAVLEALESGKLSGCAVDVLETEPPIDLDFINHPKTIVTSHIAGSSQEAIEAMGRAAIQGLTVNAYPSNYEKYL